MFSIFDVFRSGYLLGQEHAQQGQRRRALWELRLTHVILWLPFVDNDSYYHGYRSGYEDGLRMRSYLQQVEEVNPALFER